MTILDPLLCSALLLPVFAALLWGAGDVWKGSTSSQLADSTKRPEQSAVVPAIVAVLSLLLLVSTGALAHFSMGDRSAMLLEIETSEEMDVYGETAVAAEMLPRSIWLLDAFSLFWLPIQGTCFIWCCLRPTVVRSVPRSASVLLLLAFSCLNGAVLMDHVLLQLTCLSLAFWFILGERQLALNDEQSDVFQSSERQQQLSTAFTGWSPVIVAWMLADLLWLGGYAGLYFLTGNLTLTAWTAATPLVFENETARALLGTALLGMHCSLFIRLGCFPFVSWVTRWETSTRSLTLLLLGPWLAAAMLLLRWSPVLFQSEEICNMLIGLSGLSALLLGLSGLFHVGLQRWRRLLGIPLGLTVLGLAVDVRLWPQMTGFLLGTLILGLLLPILAVVSNRDPGSQFPLGFSRQTLRRLQAGLSVWLLCGPCGVEPLMRLTLFPQAETLAVPVVIPALIALTVMLFAAGSSPFVIANEEGSLLVEPSSEGLLSVPSARQADAFSGSSDAAPMETACENITPLSRSLWLGSGLFLVVTSLPILIWGAQFGPFEGLLPLISLPAVLAGWAIADWWQRCDIRLSGDLEGLMKLCREDYHLEKVFDRGLAIPVETAARLTELFDRYLLRRSLPATARFADAEAREVTDLITSAPLPWLQPLLLLLLTGVLILASTF